MTAEADFRLERPLGLTSEKSELLTRVDCETSMLAADNAENRS